MHDVAPVGRPGAGRGARWFGRGVAVYAVVVAVCVVVLPRSWTLQVVRYAASVALLGSCAVCLWTAREQQGAERWWRVFMGATLLGGAAVRGLQLVGNPQSGQLLEEANSTTVVVILSWLSGLIGLLLYPSDPLDVAIRGRAGRRGGRWHLITALDSLIVAGAISLLVWILVLRDVASVDGEASTLLFYSSSTALGAGLVVVVVLIAAFRRPRRPFGLLLLGLAQIAFTFYSLGQIRAHVHGQPDDLRVFDLGFAVAPFLIAWATLLPPAPVAGPGLTDRRGVGRAPLRRWWHVLLPYLPLVAAGVVTLLDLMDRRGLTPELWALLGLLALALLRQMTTLTDNVRLVARIEDDQLALRYQAFHDPLTGLANRALFGDRLAQALARRARSPTPLAVLFCDVDDFKHVNDALGHAAGDKLLQVLARRLVSVVRTSDTVARLGGDEFAILLDGCAENPTAVGTRLIDLIGRPVPLAQGDHTVRASIGLVVVDQHDGPVTPEMLLHRADVAMYAAKAAGKGGLVVYSSELIVPERAALLPSALSAALSGGRAVGRLAVDFRPIVALPGGAVVGQQARLTWTHPTVGLVEPFRLPASAVPQALAHALEQRLLDSACAHAANVHDRAGRAVPVVVPVAASRLSDEMILEEVQMALAAAKLPPRALILELSATARTADLITAVPTLDQLRELGVRIALAQLGAPDTTVDALRVLPLDLVVLDGRLTRPVSGDREDHRTAVLLSALLGGLHKLGTTTVATGVDDQPAADRARRLGCALAIGQTFGDWRADPRITAGRV